MKNLMKTLSFNTLFVFFLATGFCKATDVSAALSALNQSLVNMQAVLSSPLIQTELSPYERVILLQEMKREEGHIYFTLKTEVIIEKDEKVKYYVVDVSIKPNTMPGRPLLEVISIHRTHHK